MFAVYWYIRTIGGASMARKSTHNATSVDILSEKLNTLTFTKEKIERQIIETQSSMEERGKS